MKKVFSSIPKPLLLLLLLLSAAGLSSCASTDEGDNASARPWNQPKGWENGMPAGMTEGRYGR